MAARPEVIHPYIEWRPGVCGGSAVITGTRISVRSVAGYVLKLKMSPEQLAREFPSPTLAQIHDALSYYYDHQAEIDQELAETTEVHWRAEWIGGGVAQGRKAPLSSG